MAKRFVSTEIWDEDWFLDMPVGYKLFWFYMLAACNHAGLFKVNIKRFCGVNEVKISQQEALTFFNNGKERIRVISDSLWLIEDFFVFQYGTTLNSNSSVHFSIEKAYNQANINLTSIRGLRDLKVRDKDKDKDKDKDIIKKGQEKKIYHEIKGKEFTDEGYVLLDNGQLQELGKSQKVLLQHESLKPSDIYKNYIV